MTGSDPLGPLLAVPWHGVVDLVATRPDLLSDATLEALAGLADEGWTPAPGHPDATDLWIMVALARAGGPHAARRYIEFVSALDALDGSGPGEGSEADRLVLLHVVVRQGLAVVEVLRHPVILEAALARLREVDATATVTPELRCEVAELHLAAYDLHRDPAHLDDAVTALRFALDPPAGFRRLTGEAQDAARVALAHALAVRARHGAGPDPAGLHEAEAIAHELTGPEPHAPTGTAVGSLLVELYRATGEVGYLDDALDADTPAATEPESAPGLVLRATALELRHAAGGDPADLDGAIDAATRAADLLAEGADGRSSGDEPPEATDRLAVLQTLERLLSRRHDLTGAVDDLRASLSAAEEALSLQPRSGGWWDTSANNLGNRWSHLYRLTRDRRALVRSVELGEAALELCAPHEDALLGLYRRNLSARLAELHELDGDDEALDRAVFLLGVAVAEAPESSRDLLRSRRSLATRLLARFDAKGHPSDLDQAITILESPGAAPQALPDEELWDWANVLSLALGRRWEQIGDPADLDQAITTLHAVVDDLLVDPDHGQEQEAVCLGNLGMFLNQRFRLRGDIADLDAAIRFTEIAVSMFPRGHVHHTGYTTNLAQRHLTRFELTGDPEAAEACMRLMHQVVDDTPTSSPAHALQLGNLGIMLVAIGHQLVQMGGSGDALPLLDEAARHLRSSLDTMGPGARGRVNVLAGLGEAHLERHLAQAALGAAADPADLDAAVAELEEARNRFPAGGPDAADAGAALALALATRAERSGRAADGVRAWSLADEALSLTPVDHPRRSEREALVRRLAR